MRRRKLSLQDNSNCAVPASHIKDLTMKIFMFTAFKQDECAIVNAGFGKDAVVSDKCV